MTLVYIRSLLWVMSHLAYVSVVPCPLTSIAPFVTFAEVLAQGVAHGPDINWCQAVLEGLMGPGPGFTHWHSIVRLNWSLSQLLGLYVVWRIFFFVLDLCIFILCVWLVCLHVCLCTVCMCTMPRKVRLESDTLELELEMAVSCLSDAGILTQVLSKGSQCSQTLSHLSSSCSEGFLMCCWLVSVPQGCFTGISLMVVWHNNTKNSLICDLMALLIITKGKIDYSCFLKLTVPLELNSDCQYLPLTSAPSGHPTRFILFCPQCTLYCLKNQHC